MKRLIFLVLLLVPTWSAASQPTSVNMFQYTSFLEVLITHTPTMVRQTEIDSICVDMSLMPLVFDSGALQTFVSVENASPVGDSVEVTIKPCMVEPTDAYDACTYCLSSNLTAANELNGGDAVSPAPVAFYPARFWRVFIKDDDKASGGQNHGYIVRLQIQGPR